MISLQFHRLHIQIIIGVLPGQPRLVGASSLFHYIIIIWSLSSSHHLSIIISSSSCHYIIIISASFYHHIIIIPIYVSSSPGEPRHVGAPLHNNLRPGKHLLLAIIGILHLISSWSVLNLLHCHMMGFSPNLLDTLDRMDPCGLFWPSVLLDFSDLPNPNQTFQTICKLACTSRETFLLSYGWF